MLFPAILCHATDADADAEAEADVNFDDTDADAQMRAKLEAHGGRVYENAIPEGVQMHPDAASLTLRSSAAAGGATASTSGSSDGHVSGVHHIRTRLVLDCMGHASPIVKQIRYVKHACFIVLVVLQCSLSSVELLHSCSCDGAKHGCNRCNVNTLQHANDAFEGRTLQLATNTVVSVCAPVLHHALRCLAIWLSYSRV